MSYVDEVIELVVKKNPDEPEFHQAVKEVLESLRAVVEAHEEEDFRHPVWAIVSGGIWHSGLSDGIQSMEHLQTESADQQLSECRAGYET